MKNGSVALKKHNLKEKQNKKVIKLSLVSSIVTDDPSSPLYKQKHVGHARLAQEQPIIANDTGHHSLKGKRHISECHQKIFPQVGTVSIKIKSFDQLTAFEIYNILKLRQDTFVLEKEIMYEDIDCMDYHSIHVWCQTKTTGDFLAYLRIVPIEDKREVSIGRVLTVPDARGLGIARQLMENGIDFSCSYYSNSLLKLYAREELCPFYEILGFEKTGPIFFYPEKDPIPNIPMIYNRKVTNAGSLSIRVSKEGRI